MKNQDNGIELNYVVEGNGPWLVMSHSLACDLSMWDEAGGGLRRNYKVLRFDTRGHGKSDSPGGEYTLDMLAYDVHGLLQGLGVDRCHWVGPPMGGMIGQTFALKFRRCSRPWCSPTPPAATRRKPCRSGRAASRRLKTRHGGAGRIDAGRWFTSLSARAIPR